MRLPTLLAVLLVTAGAAAAQGRLAVDAPTHDFGRIAEAEAAQHTFRFTNAGDAPLRLTRVEAACGCTTPSWTDTAVPPGGEGQVEVAFDPEGRSGPFEKTVYVVAEGADPAALTLRIAGTVVPSFVAGGVAQGSLTFERDRVEVASEGGAAQAAGAQPAEAQTSFRFANTGERPIRIERVEAPAGVDVVFPERPVFPDQTGGLFVTVPAGSPADVELVLHTTDADVPVKRLALRVGPPRPAGGE
ncbi:DUF1573 domain-containing protein [Rubrivirga sp. S365]|nr:DUF1573 domain-containing protein [Rubrivirga sp. S365]MDT7857864.1 DUF1573 domain-containing protein [Rubrivirga sp. S365]